MLSRHRICKNTDEFTRARIVTFLNPYTLLKLIEADTDLERFGFYVGGKPCVCKCRNQQGTRVYSWCR